MLIIRGVNLFPSQVEELILRYPQLAPHYVLEVCRDGSLDELTVRVEPQSGLATTSDCAQAAADLQHHIKVYIGITADVVLVAPGAVERSVGKAKRVIDRRT